MKIIIGKGNFLVLIILYFFVYYNVHSQMDSANHPDRQLAECSTDSCRSAWYLTQSEWLVNRDYPAAKDAAKKSVELARQAYCNLCLAKSLSNLAIINWINGAYPTAITANLEALKIREILNDSSGIASNYHNIGLIYFYKADYTRAIAYYKKAFSIAEALKDTLKMVKLYAHIGLVYDMEANYTKSIENLLHSARLKVNMEGYNVDFYPLRGFNNETDKSYYNKEIEHQLKALNEEIKRGKSIDLANAHHNLAKNYYYMDEYEKALHHFKTSIRIKSEFGIIPFWNDLAKTYNKLNRFDSAIYTSRKALKVYSDRGTRINISATYISSGDIYLSMHDHDNALRSYFAALDLESAMGNRQAIASLYRRIAEVYSIKMLYERAFEFAEKSLVLTTEIQAGNTIRKSLQALVDVSEKSGNYTKAFNYQKQYRYLNDSLEEGETKYKLAQMGLQYEIDMKNIEVEKLEQQNLVNESKLELNKLILYFTIGSLLMLFLLVATIFSRYRQKNESNKILRQQSDKISKQNRLLEKSNKEKEMFLGEIHHRVKNNLQVVCSLLSIQSHLLTDKKASEAVKEGQTRVQAMGLIHENLYQHHDFATIDMQEYLEHLCNSLVGTFGFDLNKFRLEVEAGSISLDLDTAIPLGLIANELVTNCLKHAYKNTKMPVLRLSLKVKPEGLCLEVKDNGCGYDHTSGKGSFGTELVEAFTRKLNGKIHISNSKGTVVCIVIKKYKMAA